MDDATRRRRYRVATVELFGAAELARLRGDATEWRRLVTLGVRTVAALRRYDDTLMGPMG